MQITFLIIVGALVYAGGGYLTLWLRHYVWHYNKIDTVTAFYYFWLWWIQIWFVIPWVVAVKSGAALCRMDWDG